MTKANVPPNVPPNVSDIHTYTLRTLLRIYRRTDDGKKTVIGSNTITEMITQIVIVLPSY